MVEAPKNSMLLSATEIGDTWVDTKREWMIGLFQAILGGVFLVVVSLFIGLGRDTVQILVLIWAFTMLASRYQNIGKKKSELDFIAISSGHPWHHSEDVDDTAVFVLDQGEQWIALDGDVRIVTTNDPLLGHILLRDGDSEGKVLARCEFIPYAFSDVIKIINMAQALASAQDRGEDYVDSFDAARDREETAEGLLEREWMDTDEGAVDYEPGAILRAFKRSKDDGGPADAVEFKESSNIDSE